MNTPATPPTPAAPEIPGSRFVEIAPGAGAPLRIEYRWIDPGRREAPLAVFLHEGLGSVAMWKDWPQTLCARLGLRGLVYSRAGYGRSTPRPHALGWPVDFMTREACDVLPALLDALRIDAAERARMWLVGHSDGGSIALLYASAFPDALQGAVAIAPHVFVEALSVASIAEAKTAYESQGLRARLARYHDDVDSAFYGWNDIWLAPTFRDWTITPALARIRCRLLAIQADDDHYGTMAQIDAIAQAVPHALTLRLARGGHSPHRDNPAALDDAIEAFMTGPHASTHDDEPLTKEMLMPRCEACQHLIGQPAAVPPHGDLQEAGADVAGTALHPVRRYERYRCTVCGCRLRRNTAQGDPPGIWSCEDAAPGA
jgi:pimeloyl-ACP methyl ester carboxylesterase